LATNEDDEFSACNQLAVSRVRGWNSHCSGGSVFHCGGGTKDDDSYRKPAAFSEERPPLYAWKIAWPSLRRGLLEKPTGVQAQWI
jgi:hypothetical protein